MHFPCNQCGACCRRMVHIGSMPHKEDGSCIHLQEDNRCAIYATRPLECNIHDMFDVHDKKLKLSKQGYTRKDYYAINSEACNKMQEIDGMPEHFRIDMRVYDEG